MDEDNMKEFVDKYITTFKSNLIDRFDLTEEIEKFVTEYPDINLVLKKKRLRNTIPDEDRCHANKASGERCTRKKKTGEEVCGTHLKGTPHGLSGTQTGTKNNKKIDVWTQEILGIVYYIDNNKNVYSSMDILKNIPNPSVIGSYDIDSSGEYSISHF